MSGLCSLMDVVGEASKHPLQPGFPTSNPPASLLAAFRQHRTGGMECFLSIAQSYQSFESQFRRFGVLTVFAGAFGMQGRTEVPAQSIENRGCEACNAL
jgi:hypothetical protein